MTAENLLLFLLERKDFVLLILQLSFRMSPKERPWKELVSSERSSETARLK